MWDKLRLKLYCLCNSYKKIVSATVAAVLLLVLCLYVATPVLIKSHLNNTVLANLGDYTGYVEDVDWRFMRLAYSIQGVRLVRKGIATDAPFFYAKDFVISLSGEALLRGKLRVNAVLENTELNFIDSPEAARRQAGLGTNWLEVLRAILPTSLHSLTLKAGAIRFINQDVKPEVTLAATHINAHLNNLSNVMARSQDYAASGVLEAALQNKGRLNARASFDAKNFDDFSFSAKATNVNLTDFNDFSKAYGNVDFQSGFGNIFVELKADDGELLGYAKPFFENVSIASWEQDVKQQKDNPVDLLWEFGWEVFKALLTNQKTDKIATTIDIDGTISKAEIQSWPIVLGIIKNAFIDALEENYNLGFID